MKTELEWMTGGGADEDDDELDSGKKIYGVVTGTVVPFIPDPQGLGRVRVTIPTIDALDPIAWARIAAPSAGLFHGNYFIPNPGDEVLVAFENGDVNSPYIVGALWHNINRPPLPLSELQIRTIRTLAGNQIVFTEIPPTITIQTPAPPNLTPMPPSPVGPHSTITLMPKVCDITAATVSFRAGANLMGLTAEAGITLMAGPSLIHMGPEGLLIAYGANSIVLNAAGITIQGKPFVNINPV